MIPDGAAPEFRSCPGDLRFVIDEATGNRTIVGYAVSWDVLSTMPIPGPKGPFFEKVARGAFLESLASPEIGCFWNHDTGKPLGRTGAGTLVVSEDDRGLLYQCVPPAVTYAADLAVSMDRRDVWGSSFGFYTIRDKWNRDAQGRLIRTVEKGWLFDVSPVSRPTYRGTDVALRSLDLWLAAGEEPPTPTDDADDSARIAYLDRRLRLAALSGPRRPR